MRHKPTEPELERLLPWLALEEPDTYNAYQRTQTVQAERMLQRAEYLISCIGAKPGQGLFVGLYRVAGSAPLTRDEYWAIPEYMKLKSKGLVGFEEGRAQVLRFDLQVSDKWSDWKGRLIFKWTGSERSWAQWVGQDNFPIHAVHEDSQLHARMPDWRDLILTWEELHSLPSSWQLALKQWRGIYYIFDQAEKRGYVGSASGDDNLFGRWTNYKKTSHGGNTGLKMLDPRQFLFSILELLPPSVDGAPVILAENRWKSRLHTRKFGLNKN
jgi:hypothetical protein